MSAGTARVRLSIPEGVDPGAVTGASDELLRAIEALSDADVTLRGDTVSIAGDPAEVELLTRVIQELFAAAREGDCLRADDVERLIGALRREDARAQGKTSRCSCGCPRCTGADRGSWREWPCRDR